MLGMESCRQYTRPLQGTAERCQDFSQGYAFCVPLGRICEQDSHPGRGARNPRHPFRVRFLALDAFQGYAKTAYPWLTSQHASGVHRMLPCASTSQHASSVHHRALLVGQ